MGNGCSSSHSLVDKNIQHEIKLIQKNHPSLVELRYDENNDFISDHDAVAIATALRHNYNVQTLTLRHGVFPLVGYYALSKALEINKNIRRLSIYIVSNHITGLNIIAEMLRRNQTSFKELRLYTEYHIPVTGFIDVLNAVSGNTRLEHISLCYRINTFTPDGTMSQLGQGWSSDGVMLQLGQAMGDILRYNTTLTVMEVAYLHATPISDSAIRLLVSGLKVNKTLKVFMIAAVSNEGLVSIADALRHNSSLRNLYLDCRNFTLDGIAVLFRALEYNETLENLFLCGELPELDDGTRTTILDSLQFNNTLTEFSGMRYDDPSYVEIREVIETPNRTTPKKDSRKRYNCMNWLLSNSNNW